MDIRKFDNVTTDSNGNIVAKEGFSMPEGKREDVKITQFESTVEDENGNLIASGRKDNLPNVDGHAHATVVKQFDDTVEDENGNLHTIPQPDFVK